MKKMMIRGSIVAAAILLVVIVSYNILDFYKRSDGRKKLVNEPTFNPLDPRCWDDALATEGHLDKAAIEAHFNSAKLEHFESIANEHQRIQIAYRQFPVAKEKGAVVISSGRTESMLVYQELIHDLNGRGYSVYIHDHRGQGLSGRLLVDEPQKSYVDQFDYYVADLKAFRDLVVEPDRTHRLHRPLFLLAHSMGGGIASLYIERYPYDFDAAALVTPMHAPDVPGFAVPGASVMAAIPFLRKHYALGQQGYIARDFVDTNADLTHSRTRFEWMKQIYQAEAQRKGAADPRLGGLTHQWLNAANRAAATAVSHASDIRIPVLILQASDDTAVSNKAQGEFCQNSATRCQGFLIPKAFHAIFNEADTYRVPAMTKILDFFQQGKTKSCD